MFKNLYEDDREYWNYFHTKKLKEDNSLSDYLRSLATDDYQNRGRDYPESGEPDTISVFNNYITFAFKNTSEGRAKSWVERFLNSKGLKADRISTNQTGYYEDDWVDCSARVTGFLNESSSDHKIISYRDYDIDYNLYGRGEYTLQYDGDDLVFDTLDAAKEFIDSLHSENESKRLNEKLYSRDEIQSMLTKVKKDPKLKQAVLKQFGKNHADQNAISDVISNGWVDRFERYDSAVCDNFIQACVKLDIKESCEYQNGSYKVYFNNRQENVRTDAKGPGMGDYEVYKGNVFVQSFDTYNDAVEFIDSELEESHVKSVTNMILEGVSVREALQGHHSRGVEDELKILSVTLMTEFIYQRAKEDIPKADFVWWLKNTTIKGDKSLYVDTDGSVGKCDPTVTNAVRPVLRIAVYSNTGRITVGTKFKFAGEIFTVLSVDYAICDGFIGACQFDDGVHPVDVPFEETKLYKYINSWFNKNKNSAIELL